jgi:hypothetical protein
MMRHYPGCDDQPTGPAATDGTPPSADAESEKPKEETDDEIEILGSER